MISVMRSMAVVLVALVLALAPAAPAGVAAAAAPSAEQSFADEAARGLAAGYSGKWIEVILSRQRLNAWQNGRIVMTSLISSGVARYPTRRGVFRVYIKLRSTRMRGPGYDLRGVPWTMYYSGSYAIHGAYWHNNFGWRMSHGCINLPVAFAGRLYAWTPVGTRVVVR